MNQKEIFADLDRRAELGGGEDRLRRHRDTGKLIAALGAIDAKRDRNSPKKHGNIPF